MTWTLKLNNTKIIINNTILTSFTYLLTRSHGVSDKDAIIIIRQNEREGERLRSIKILFVIMKSKVTKINHPAHQDPRLRGPVKEKIWNFAKSRSQVQ